MNRARMLRLTVVYAVTALAAIGCSRAGDERPTPERLARGKELFAVYCSGCHPDGDNRLYPQKSLHRFDLKANGIATAGDIVAIMRSPGPGMKPFDRRTIAGADAEAIAQYVLATF